jgi:hypothetical protein
MTKVVDAKQPTVDAAKKQADLEMNATTEGSETVSATEASADIPTVMDLVYDFNGSLGFAVGSSGFILAMYYENWLPYFRYGSLLWIWGCVAYAIPLFLKFKDGLCPFPWDIGDWGVFLCCLLYTIGCILGGFYDEEAVEAFLPAINHTFLYGSLALALEPLYEFFLSVKNGGSCRSRLTNQKLFGLSPDNNDENAELKLNWDRFYEIWAMIGFCVAGSFGGFPPHPSLALPGVYFWMVGSLFAVARSFHMLYLRRQGLRAQAAPNK